MIGGFRIMKKFFLSVLLGTVLGVSLFMGSFSITVKAAGDSLSEFTVVSYTNVIDSDDPYETDETVTNHTCPVDTRYIMYQPEVYHQATGEFAAATEAECQQFWNSVAGIGANESIKTMSGNVGSAGDWILWSFLEKRVRHGNLSTVLTFTPKDMVTEVYISGVTADGTNELLKNFTLTGSAPISVNASEFANPKYEWYTIETVNETDYVGVVRESIEIENTTGGIAAAPAATGQTPAATTENATPQAATTDTTTSTATATTGSTTSSSSSSSGASSLAPATDTESDPPKKSNATDMPKTGDFGKYNEIGIVLIMIAIIMMVLMIPTRTSSGANYGSSKRRYYR